MKFSRIIQKVYHRFYYKNRVDFYDKNKFIFIHIPKNSGLSILRSMNLYGADHYPAFCFQQLLGEKRYSDLFKFAIIRCPEDRIISCFHYLKNRHINTMVPDYLWQHYNLSSFDNVNDFVLNWLDEKTMWTWHLIRPQISFITINDCIAVNCLFSFNFQDEMRDFLSKRLRYNFSNIHINKGDYKKGATSQLSTAAIQKIHHLYKDDLTLYNQIKDKPYTLYNNLTN